MLRIKRIYEPPSPRDGLRILVERLWPRGMAKERAKVDIWCRDVSPSPKLHKWYGHRPERFPEFKERYLGELQGNEKVERLAALAEKRDVTLVFAARDEARSNATVLYELLNDRARR